MKEIGETEELDEREEDAEEEAVPVENESYVNLRKKIVNKHNQKMDNLLQVNGKLCREFQRKQVQQTKEIHTDISSFGLICIHSGQSCVLMHWHFSILLFTQSSRRFRSMLDERKKLPAWHEKENILDTLDRCQVLVVSGMTGCVTQSNTA